MSETNPGAVAISPRGVATVLTAGGMLFPLLSLLGWWSGVRTLASFGVQFIPMGPSTAICFLLLDLSLLMLLRSSLGRVRIVAASIAGIVVALYGFLTILGYSGGLPLAPDALLFPDLNILSGIPVGGMALSAGGFFLLAGFSLLATGLGLSGRKFANRWSLWAALSAAVVSLGGLIFVTGYAYRSPLFSEGNVIPMALTTGLAFLFLGGGLTLTAGLERGRLDQRLPNVKNLKIGTQLRIGLGVIMLLVAFLGAASWFQAGSLWQTTADLYNHPLTVRRALDQLSLDILYMHLDMRDLVLTENEVERQAIIQSIDTYAADTTRQFDFLYSSYLGPRTDIDQAYYSFIEWNSIRDETIRLLRADQAAEAFARTHTSGIDVSQFKKIMLEIQDISIFAKNKGDQFYADAQLKKDNLTISLVILVGAIFLLTLGASYFLVKGTTEPLQELTLAVEQFRQGKLDFRSRYVSANEFGLLSTAFNKMAETIEMEIKIRESSASIAGTMLKEDDLRVFCKSLLKNLLAQTGSQVAAIYLLNEQKTDFEHFESIGLSPAGQASFSATGLEGEFGAALATGQIQHISDIPEGARFTFATVGGVFQPREIITIPIASNGGFAGVISLASLRCYPAPAVQLVKDIWGVLTARLNGVLAFRKVRAFAEQLEQQNRELEMQKNELNTQTIELNQQNSELEAQKMKLGEASRMKTSFISNMSHELRTPLNSVIALSGVLNRRLADQIPEEEYSYLEVIERNGKHLLALINDILDLSRIEAGREEIELSQFEMTNLVTEVVSLLTPLAEQKKIELLLHPAPGLPPMVSDMTKCRHILQNLVGNAVKFTEAGRVEITLLPKGDTIDISVRDTGIGISKDHLPHIFDEFRQADSSTSRKFGGTGLGLAIVKKYTELLGGSISVRSTLGEGSVFTLSLPLRLMHERAASKAEEGILNAIPDKPHLPLSPADRAQKTILLVEDSEPAVIQLKDILEEYAYQILVARNGGEALDIIQYILPDAILLDLMMPGVDGFAVLKTVREAERTAHLPVLILTAKHITPDELKFLKRNNVHQLIQKGEINRSDLLKAVEEMVTARTVPVDKPQRPRQVIAGKPVVLVVEDNPDNMLTAKALLAGDFTVIEATDGKSAIVQARLNIPHLILMDIALPELDGIQAFHAIRKETRLQNIPVIALTASAMTTDRETILSYGFDGYIPKPIDQKVFMQTIQRVLYGKE